MNLENYLQRTSERNRNTRRKRSLGVAISIEYTVGWILSGMLKPFLPTCTYEFTYLSEEKLVSKGQSPLYNKEYNPEGYWGNWYVAFKRLITITSKHQKFLDSYSLFYLIFWRAKSAKLETLNECCLNFRYTVIVARPSKIVQYNRSIIHWVHCGLGIQNRRSLTFT